MGEKGDGKSFVISQEYIDAIKSSLQPEMRKDFEAKKDKLLISNKNLKRKRIKWLMI